MLDQLEKLLNKEGIFEDNTPKILTAIANAIPSRTIPYKMKLAFAVSELILFTSQFKRNIQHWNGSSIPVNAITFCIAKSGASKDSSAKAARKCFQSGYNLLETYRKEKAKELAITAAEEEHPDGDNTVWAVYKNYYNAPNPLFVAPSTVEGFIQHLNDLEEGGIGSGYIFSGEVGAELASSMTLVENIKIISEIYDEGNKEVKVLKDRTAQSKEVKGLAVNALFLGSQDNLLDDETIKRIFRREFTTKLARRSFFVFANEDVDTTFNGSIDEFLRLEREIEDQSVDARDEVLQYINELTVDLLDVVGEAIEVEDDVRNLFTLYKKYNEELSKTIDNQFPISKLTRNHLQWKALKLSGALAIIDGRDKIELQDYKGAISFVELINKDIFVFEKELVKEAYETFARYCKENAKDRQLFIGLHSLRKMGYIPMKGSPTTKMKELVQLVQSYDPSGIYVYKQGNEEGIFYEEIDMTDTILISYVQVAGTKEQRQRKCNKGFITEELKFPDLVNVLQTDLAYTPFRFREGIRGKDNIDSGCKWIVLDVDTSDITDREAHILLADINHFIVRTSDPTNEFKFRILLELDMEIDIPDASWKKFIRMISNDLGITTDLLPKSQIFFSYSASGEYVLSVLDANPLAVKDYVVTALEQEPKTEKKLTSKQKSHLLEDRLTTFHPAYNASKGERSRKLIWAAKYAKELGADKSYVLDLMHDIHDEYWVNPLEGERFENTIIRQIERWSF